MKLGITQKLEIKRLTSVGAFVNDASAEHQDVLLPAKWVPKGAKAGDSVECFLLLDGDDRPLATTRKPYVEVGGFALLEVTDVARVGAFLDWGLDKELFLPFSEQIQKVKVKDKVLVYVYVDKSGRIAATMKTKGLFSKPSGLSENDSVEGVVYSSNPDIGSFVLVEGKYNGLIRLEDRKGALHVGQKVSLRVKDIKKDGKIDLSMFPRAHHMLDRDAEHIYAMLKSNNGYLRVNDKSDPEDIRMLFGLSKAQFKRSVGRLLKNNKIRFADGGIEIIAGGGKNE